LVLFSGACGLNGNDLVEDPAEILSGAQPGSEGVGDLYYPKLGNGGYDVQHYDLDLYIDVYTQTLEGMVSIDAVAMQDLSSFNLDFSEYEIEEIKLNGQEAGFEQNGLELTIICPTPILKNEDFMVSVKYQGNPSDHVQWNKIQGGPPDGLIFYEDGAYTHGEPIGASYWFPTNEHPSDKATYSIRVTVPEPMEVASNGRLVETVDNGDTRTFVWEPRDPMASYLVTIGIADFDVVEEEGPRGLPVKNYFHGDIPQSKRDEFKDQVEMIRFFETVFGPYPFETYGSLVNGVAGSFALETQTLSTFSASYTLSPSTTINVVAHELAHQWIGNSISLVSWKDIWLKEGIATYAEVLWMDHTEGKTAADELVLEYYDRTARNDHRVIPPGDPGKYQMFNDQVYDRGALTMHALRLRVGDQAFFDILLTFHERFKNGNATTTDFIALAEEISGSDLKDLFDAWLYQQYVPDIPEMALYRGDFTSVEPDS
jgi:aminopeptidase N